MQVLLRERDRRQADQAGESSVRLLIGSPLPFHHGIQFTGPASDALNVAPLQCALAFGSR
jgi:hypothetical protein